MRYKVALVACLLLMSTPPLYGEILSGELISKGEASFVVKDLEGNQHQLRFDQETTFTVLMDSKETRVKNNIQIEPGSRVMAFEEEGYTIYFQLICKSAGGSTECVRDKKKK